MKDVNLLKTNGFDVDSVLESFGGMDLYDEILNDFLTEADERFIKLKEYKDNNDMKNYAIMVHSIKGECAYLGINGLANMAYAHQLKSQENDLEFINLNFNSLMNELTRIVNVIKTYFGK